jgi:monoamine oxidase
MKNPVAVLEKDWCEEEESYFSIMKPGGYMERDCLTSPVGNLYWAGTETAESWMGYMDGALQSGESVANTIIKELLK